MTTAIGSRLYVTDTGSATPTGVGSTPAPYFAFTTWSSPMDTCGSTTVQWQYIADAPCNTTLLASSTIMPNPGDAGTPIMGIPIAQDVDAGSDSFSWSPVNLTAGGYILRATGPGIAAESSIFTVVNGTNTSCLTGTSTPSPASAVKRVPDVNGPTGPTTQVSLVPLETKTPQPFRSAEHHSHSGTIAGSIAGGIGVFVAILIAGDYLRRRCAQPHRMDGEREREKNPGGCADFPLTHSRAQDDAGDVSSTLGDRTVVTSLNKQPRLEPNRHQPSIALTEPARVQVHSYVQSETPDHEPPITSSTPSTPPKEEPATDPFDDGLSVSSRLHSYRMSGTDTDLLGSPAPSSATSQMYRGRDSDVSVWSHWRSLREDRRDSRVLNGSSPAYSLEDLATMPPLQIA